MTFDPEVIRSSLPVQYGHRIFWGIDPICTVNKKKGERNKVKVL